MNILKRNRALSRILVGVTILMELMTVSGCRSSTSVAEDSAKKYLNQKYEQEFEVLSASQRAPGGLPDASVAMLCAPADDPAKVFESVFSINGDYWSDHYAQRLIADQAAVAADDTVSQLAENYSMHGYVYDYDMTAEDWRQTANLDYFLQHHTDVAAYLDIYLDSATLKQTDAAREYALLRQLFSDTLPGFSVSLYFLDARSVAQCRSYWETNVKDDQVFWDIVTPYPRWDDLLKSGSFHMSEAEYASIRAKAGKKR